MFPRSILMTQSKHVKMSESASLTEQFSPMSNFMSDIITDDLLIEIFLRLPDPTHAITVCKRWLSLISAVDFVSTFIASRLNDRHNIYPHRAFHDSHTLITSLTFRFRSSLATSIFSDAALAVRGPEVSLRRADLGFIPQIGNENVFFESCSEDLLAISGPDSSFYICNIYTRQWLRLPNRPYRRNRGPCAIVCKPMNTLCDVLSYRILQIGYVKAGNIGQFQIVILSSETGRWSAPMAGPCLVPGMAMVSGKGLLFWIDDKLKRVFSLDPFRSPDDPEFYSSFDLPGDIASEETQYRGLPLEIGPWKSLRFGSSRARLRIGTVSGQLRLAQMFRARGVGFVLKVWELNSVETSSWVLVHEGRLKAEVGKDWMFFLSFHPDDGDVIFLLRDMDVYRYHIPMDSYEKVGPIFSGEKYKGVDKNMVPFMLNVYPLRKPVWPNHRLAASFCRAYFEKVSKVVTLMATHSWSVGVYFSLSNLFRFTGGWVWENLLCLGDGCVFELINKNEIALKVTIFRVNG